MSTNNIGLKPLGPYVVVELEFRETSAMGILLPKNEKTPGQGPIVALGTGPNKEEDKPLWNALKIGMKVLFRQYAGTEFEHNEKKYVVLNVNDIMCEITE
jgi:chaperonin GroES